MGYTIESRNAWGGAWRRDVLGWATPGTLAEAQRAIREIRRQDSSREYRIVKVAP